VKLALQDTDRRVGEGKPVAPSFLLACVLWADVRKGWERRLQPRGNQRPPPPFAALQVAVDEAFENRIGDVSGRGKLGSDMREIWTMQPRFEKRVGTSPYSLVDQPRFRAGFDFMRLRAQTGEIDDELAQWWETFQNVSDDDRAAMIEEQRKSKPGASKARRVKRTDGDHPANTGKGQAVDVPRDDPRFRTDVDGSDTDDGGQDADDRMSGSSGDNGDAGGAAAPKKRRRRRRKPSGGGGNGDEGGAAPAAGGSE
jgi:poly(A) polymerase